jgi:hypothetical protein
MGRRSKLLVRSGAKLYEQGFSLKVTGRTSRETIRKGFKGAASSCALRQDNRANRAQA